MDIYLTSFVLYLYLPSPNIQIPNSQGTQGKTEFEYPIITHFILNSSLGIKMIISPQQYNTKYS